MPEDGGCRYRADGSAEADCHIRVDELARLKSAIRAVEADAIYGLGDLVYPLAPSCQKATGAPQRALAVTIGAFYAELGAPVWLVLGNHDLGHLRPRAGRLRCIADFVDQVPTLGLPAAQYQVDHGLARVLVVNSNLRDPALLPTAHLQEAAKEDPWLIVAGHHVLRTAFEKQGQHPAEPPPLAGWLARSAVAPDLWANGHAHTLQLGVFDVRALAGEAPGTPPLDVLALTSGAGSKLRANPSCGAIPHQTPSDALACQDPTPMGMPDFAMARFGFAVVDLSEDEMVVRILDLDGRELHRHRRNKTQIRLP